MAVGEVFQNPTVKSVSFEIRFPNLFYMENKIGDYQVKIMSRFPESALAYRGQCVFADFGPELKTEEVSARLNKDVAAKLWEFRAKDGCKVTVSTRALAISSDAHKTYKLGTADENFRDVISYVLTGFFEVVSVPLVSRIGLRYIDQCPVPRKDNATFRSYYNTVFPLDRFNIASLAPFQETWSSSIPVSDAVHGILPRRSGRSLQVW